MYSFLYINKLVAHCDARNTFTKHKMLAYTKEFMAFVFVTFRKYVAFSNFSSAELSIQYTSIQITKQKQQLDAYYAYFNKKSCQQICAYKDQFPFFLFIVVKLLSQGEIVEMIELHLDNAFRNISFGICIIIDKLAMYQF